MSNQPIGIFDSGMGGLTVAKAICKLLPAENIIYFGDTKHTPWGDKSKQTIEQYCINIGNFLVNNNCKMLVMACNTASAIADQIMQQHFPNIPIINVIDPVVEYISNNKHTSIGLIGTKQTIASNAYNNRLQHKNPNIIIKSLATPLLVPLIEEGLADDAATLLILSKYLKNPILNNINTLILGCTHYPILKPQIQIFYQNKVEIIDSTILTANTVKFFLDKYKLNNENKENGNLSFYLSDQSEHFTNLAKIFFEKEMVFCNVIL